MFGFLRQPAPTPVTAIGPVTVGCFGKLPVRADFIKHNVAHPEALALDQWVQNGYALLSRRAGGLSEATFFARPIHYGVFCGAADGRDIAWTMAPSRDASGRPYPFAIFATRNGTGTDAAVAVQRHRRFLDGARDVLSLPWRHEPFSTVVGQVDSLRPPPVMPGFREGLSETEQILGALRMTDVLRGVSRDRDDRAAILEVVAEMLATVRRRTPARTTWALRLPLAVGEFALPTLVLWLRAITHALEGLPWQPACIWQLGPQPTVTVFFRAPAASSLPALFDPALDDGQVIDVVKEAAAGGPTVRGRALADADTGSAQDFLRRLVCGGAA